MTTNAPAPESKITSMPVPHDDPASDWFFQNLASKIFPGTPFPATMHLWQHMRRRACSCEKCQTTLQPLS